MSNDGLQRTLIWLLIAAVAIYLLERLFQLFSLLATPLLLFGLAWLVALALRPLVDNLTSLGLQLPTNNPRQPRFWYLPRSLAVTFVYLALLALTVFAVLALAPTLGPQIADVQKLLPSTEAVIGMAQWVERELGNVGLRIDLVQLVPPETVATQVTSLGSTLAQSALGIASSLAVIVFDMVLVLILSFYMTLDGPRLGASTLRLLPTAWHEETRTFSQIIDRTFGGFLRAQMLQGILYGLLNAALMVAFGLNYVALVSLVVGVVVLIPIVGVALALIPPLLIAAVQAPGTFLPLLIGLLVVQQVLFNMVMPRLLGQIVGLHPLLVFAAIFVGGAVAGGWGILFGIPVVGVLASVVQFFYQRTPHLVSPTPPAPAAPPAPPPETPPAPDSSKSAETL